MNVLQFACQYQRMNEISSEESTLVLQPPRLALAAVYLL